jgi:hypothetical protein
MWRLGETRSPPRPGAVTSNDSLHIRQANAGAFEYLEAVQALKGLKQLGQPISCRNRLLVTHEKVRG